MILDQLADAIGIVSLICQHDSARGETMNQAISDLTVMCLPDGQAELDREALHVNDDVDLGREPTSAATETMFRPLYLPPQPAGASGWEVQAIISISPSCATPIPSISRPIHQSTRIG